MNGAAAVAILPLILLTGTAAILMLTIGARRNHAAAAWLTLAGLIATLAAACYGAAAPRQVTALLAIDGYARFFMALIVASAIGVVAISYPYFRNRAGDAEEMYLLLLLATLGSCVLAASIHFVSFFLGLEILSVSLYGMIGYLKNRISLEAGIKYLVLAALSSSVLLFGMALIYAESGTMDFRSAAEPSQLGGAALAGMGTVLIVAGVGFKLGVVPFHLWTPDVYQGAPAPVTAFVATASKIAMFAVLMRYFYQGGMPLDGGMFAVAAAIAAASMIAGNLLALLQSNIKRLLAYSSIAHFGYVLVALIAAGALAEQAVAFYLVAYAITTLGAFAVVSALSSRDRDADRMEDYRGLFWTHPWLAGIFSAMLLSLAGIPLTAGFIGKFYVVATGAAASAWWLILILAVTSAIGLFYYLRVVVALYSRRTEAAVEAPGFSWANGAALAVLAVALIWLGVYPGPLVELLKGVGLR